MKNKMIFILSLMLFSTSLLANLPGNWSMESTTIGNTSSFAKVQTEYLEIDSGMYHEYNMTGRSHSKTSYNYFFEGDRIRRINKFGRESFRYLELSEERLKICLYKTMKSCSIFKKIDSLPLEYGYHSIPHVETTIVWNIDGKESKTVLTPEESRSFFENNFEKGFPAYIRAFHPEHNDPRFMMFGVTLLTSLVGQEEMSLSSYHYTLVLWRGVPYGASFLVVPFTKHKKSRAINPDGVIKVEGISADSKVSVEFQFRAFR